MIQNPPQNNFPVTPRNSAREPVSTQPKHPIIDLLVTFVSIIGAYQFMCWTLTYNILEILFLLKMNDFQQIKLFLAIYLLSAAVLKIFAVILSHLKQNRQKNVFAVLSESISRSVKVFVFIAGLYIVAIITEAIEITMFTLCHLCLWLLIAEINYIFGTVGNYLFNLECLNVFGYALEGLLIIMAGILSAGMNVFDFL